MPATLLGLDFSCAPSPRKPLTLAWGRRVGDVVKLDRVDALTSLDQLDALLAAPARGTLLASGFVMACDLPLGLPRPFVEALSQQGPADLPAHLSGILVDLADTTPAPCERLIEALHHHCGDRAGFQRLIDGWGQTWHTDRPAGGKLLHRHTDTAVPGITSTSPLQTRYVPVGKMYFEGLVRLVRAGLHLPGLRHRTARPEAIALEAYPGLLSGEILGRRSYKSEADAQPERLIARMDLVDALEQGRTRLGLRLKLSPGQRDGLVADPKGDRLDAALCLVQAAWAHREAERGAPCWGLPPQVDPIEGWILTA